MAYPSSIIGAAAAGNSYVPPATDVPHALSEMRAQVDTLLKEAAGVHDDIAKVRVRVMGHWPVNGENKADQPEPDGQVNVLRAQLGALHRVICEIGNHVRALETL